MKAKNVFSRTLFRLIIFLFAVGFNSCDKDKPDYIGISVNPVSVNFGSVTVGQTLDQNVTISNLSSSTTDLIGSVSINGSGFSIVSGSGSFSLAPGQSKTVTVKFTPISGTSYSGSVSITHNATNQGSPTMVSLSGTGQPVRDVIISVSPASIDYGTVTVDQTSDQNLTISNSSTSTADLIGSVGISGTGFSIVSGSGSFNLTPGQSKSVTVRFVPTSPTSYSGSVSITHNATNQSSPTAVSLLGSGQLVTVVSISVSPASIDYGTVTIRETSDQNVTIANSSSSNANLSGSVDISGPCFSIVSGSGSFNLAPGQSKSVTVRFAPASATSYLGSVSITHSATNTSSPTMVSLSGSGQLTECTPTLVSPTNGAVLDNGCSDHSDKKTWNFDWQDCTGATKYHLYAKHTGADLPIIDNDDISSSNYTDDSYSYISDGNRFNWTWKVRAMVNGVWGPWSAERTFDVEPLNTDCATAIDVIISVSPASIDFGTVTVGQTSDQNVIIANLSSSNANLTGSVSFSGTGFSIVIGSGSFNLSPGQSKSVTVRFVPTSPTSYSGSVSITHNATNIPSPMTVELSGKGQEVVTSILLLVTPSSIDFGTVRVGQSSSYNLTIANSSGSNANLIGSVDISGSGFSIVSGSGLFILAPGQYKIVTIRFTPTSGTNYSGSVRIAHNATNQENPTTVSLTGKGQAILMSLSRISINFGIVTVDRSSEQSFTISNSPSSNAILSGSVSISGTGFSIVSSGGGSFNVSPGQSKSVTIKFSPSSPGSHSGSVSITHNATNASSPAVVSLIGTGEETFGFIVAHRGYSTSTGWAFSSADIYVGYEDNLWPINDVQCRGFAWFNVPSWIRNGTVVAAWLVVDVKDISQWNNLLNWVILEHLSSRTWNLPIIGYNALSGGSVDYKSRAATLTFSIEPDLFYLLQQSEVGFAFRAQPEIPSGSVGDQTNWIILNNPVLHVTLR